MKKLLIIASLGLVLAACNAPTSKNATLTALENPNSIAKIEQGTVQLGATVFLGNKGNAQYAPELVAAADAFVAFAASNPAGINQADIAAVISNPNLKISASTQTQVASYAADALSLFEASFQVNFPTLKPNYAIYLDALANGLYGATGKTASEVVLPVIPWPPVTPAPVVTPTPPASS